MGGWGGGGGGGGVCVCVFCLMYCEEKVGSSFAVRSLSTQLTIVIY